MRCVAGVGVVVGGAGGRRFGGVYLGRRSRAYAEADRQS